MVEAEIIEVPFDMVKETLKSIREWIDKITKLSVGIIGETKVEKNEMIVAKKDMIKQLIVLSSAMMKEEDLKEIEEFFNNIKFEKGDVHSSGGWARGIVLYSENANNKLDECVKGIQLALKKYFVPEFSKGEKY